MSLYGYGSGDPVVDVDPFGLWFAPKYGVQIKHGYTTKYTPSRAKARATQRPQLPRQRGWDPEQDFRDERAAAAAWGAEVIEISAEGVAVGGGVVLAVVNPMPGDEVAALAAGGYVIAKMAKLASAVKKVKTAAETTVSKIDRRAFRAEREAHWKAEAKDNADKYSKEDLARMKKGRAPIGPDGHPIELHHWDRTPDGGVDPMTRTDHRLGENYKKNHPN